LPSDASLRERERRKVVVERLLARLSNVCGERDAIVLKGGTALVMRLGHKARVTKDIDFDASDVDAAREILRRAVGIDLGDHFLFRILREKDAVASGVVTAIVECGLGGRTYGPGNIKIEIGRSTGPASIRRNQIPSTLEFAGFPSFDFPMISIEDHYAEKFHASTRVGFRENSRSKDLFDMVVIQDELELEQSALTDGLVRTFTVRDTHALPALVPKFPTTWEDSIRRFGEEEQRPVTLPEAQLLVEKFLNPILAGIATVKESPQ
jgi:hypothetical protein